MILYGHYPKGTVIELGSHQDYANSAHGMHIEANHDFDYTEEGDMEATFTVIHSPNGWGPEAFMTQFLDGDRVISMPNVHDNFVAASIFLRKGKLL